MWRWDDDGFPLLGEDEEVVVPEPDPPAVVIEPPPPPRIRTRYQAWCDFGIPEDLMKAVERKNRARQRKARVVVGMRVAVSEQFAEVVYDIVDEYDVSVNAVMKRLVEDGLRAFAKQVKKPELLEKAQIKDSPFEELPTAAAASAYTPQAQSYAYVAPAYEPPSIDTSGVVFPSSAPITRATVSDD